jgi:FkbM family methyltransferase
VAQVALQSVGLKAADGSLRTFQHRGTQADRGVIQQIFAAEEYSLSWLRRGPELQGLYESLLRAGRRPMILDAGANIGASVVFFALAFRQAHIVALEPARDNFELLRLNSAGLDVDARCAAIGARAGEVVVTDPGEGEWGYRTAEEGRGERVARLAAAELVREKRAAGLAPFIAKIDIEGAEEELFSADTGWIDDFPLLVVELHDWLLPKSASSRNFLRCMAARERDFVSRGENVFSIAISPAVDIPAESCLNARK